jgi:phage FluMu gp28-like protein
MDEEKLQVFAEQIGADTDTILDRWEGRPDRIIDDLFRVRDQDTGQFRDLDLFDVQRKVVHAYWYGDAGTLNTYKGRRIGYSFVVVACFLLEALFYPDSFYPLVSRSLGQAKDRIDDIQELIDSAKIEIPTEKENTDYIELWNGSAFMAYSADSDTSRGADSARAVLMDEMAFMEDEEQAHRAFGAFLALGQNRKMVQVSTPNTKNDFFMQEHRRGDRNGENGVISIKQPTFANADEIDVHTPLTEQELEPVRPELNIHQLETQRLSDPEGFGQEYLCRPVSDEYRFFGEEPVDKAIGRGKQVDHQTGLDAPKESGWRRWMGVDIGISRDDTVISVTDHNGSTRKQRELIVADDESLREAGVSNPDRANANHIAELIHYVFIEMDVDRVIMDKGGAGETFARIIERKLGHSVISFDFSARDDVADMMGDMNICLRNGEATLVPSDRLADELKAIVKEKRNEYSTPSFSGKDNSESGKDDAAIATVLSAFPPKGGGENQAAPSYRERDVEQVTTRASQKRQKEEQSHRPSNSAVQVNRQTRTRRNRHKTRHTRTR